MNQIPAIGTDAALSVARERYGQLETELRAVAERVNRLTLCALLIEAQVPADAQVSTVDWADEPNRDGTFDVDLCYLLDEDGEDLESLGGQGAINAGRYYGDTDVETDWDCFRVNPDDINSPIRVGAVYEWAARQVAQQTS